MGEWRTNVGTCTPHLRRAQGTFRLRGGIHPVFRNDLTHLHLTNWYPPLCCCHAALTLNSAMFATARRSGTSSESSRRKLGLHLSRATSHTPTD